MQRIAIIAQGSRKWIGGVEYTKNLLTAIDSLPTRSQFHVILVLQRGMEEVLFKEAAALADSTVWTEPPKQASKALSMVLKKLELPLLIKSPLHTFFSAPSPLAAVCKKERADFVYPVMSFSKGFTGMKWAAWIPDFQHKVLPHFFSKAEIETRDRQYTDLLNSAPIVVFSSQASLDDMRRYYPDAKPKATFVLSFASLPALPSSPEAPQQVQHKYNLPDRFLIVCNQFWQHKNHFTVLKALSLLRSRGLEIPLVCTGSVSDYRKPEYFNDILKFVNENGLAEQVTFLGLIPREDQWQLLRRACAVVQPSLFEGWSTVVEDSKSLGKKVFLSDLAVHREQAPVGGQYFPVEDDIRLADLIAQSWAELEAGPDLEAEFSANARSEQLLRQFGERFEVLVQTPIRMTTRTKVIDTSVAPT